MTNNAFYCRLLPLVAILLACLSTPLHAQAARVWEAPLVIPTYELGPADPNPVLLEKQRRGWHPIYPYPRLDSLTNHRVDKSYRAVYLENEYLRVTVLPELGGHLYAIFDKTANRDVLYTNHVVKYAMVAIRGAWVSGGIEWNFPDGHTLTTVSPIDYVTKSEKDGSASVTVGDTERVQRMQWAVTIRLRPGWKVVETEVTLNNRRETPGRYWFWATAAAHATDDMRFIYPMREAYPHTFWPVFSFPNEKGVDIGTYREVPNYLSLFARNSLRDFFGIYYEKSDWGVVHVSDHRRVPGKKSWTWGTDDAGNVWIEKLTDRDGQYVEFQAGRFETQMEHEFMEPHRVERFTEYWYPVDRLGGPFDEATRNAALHLAITGKQARITVNANHRFDDARVILEAASEPRLSEVVKKSKPRLLARDSESVGSSENFIQLGSQPVSLDPAKPLTVTFDLPAGALDKPLTVTLGSKEGQELLRYRTDLPVDGNPDFRPATRPVSDKKVERSAEQAYFEGLMADKESLEVVARQFYQEALKSDPGFAAAHVALGLSFYRSGLFDEAEKHLEAALLRNRYLAEAHYYLGLVCRAHRRNVEAAKHLLSAAGAGYREATAYYVLGEMALQAGNTTDAIDHLKHSVARNPLDLKARTLLARAEAGMGHMQQARENIDSVVREMPIDYLALREQIKIHRALQDDDGSGRARDELHRLLSREPDSVLELAFDYAAIGSYVDCRSLLEEAINQASVIGHRLSVESASQQVSRSAGLQAGRETELQVEASPSRQVNTPGGIYAMLHYTLGYFYEITGDKEKGLAQYALGAAADPAFVFPHRVEEIEVLQCARAANPNDGRAAYYLGNVLASKHRNDEALSAWRDAVRLDPSNAMAHRNLGKALGSAEGLHKNGTRKNGNTVAARDRAPLRPNSPLKREAVTHYERAIKLAPDDFHIYLELDRLLAELTETKRRITLLESASPAARTHSSLTLALAAAYADAGRFQDASGLLAHNSFTSGEHETSGLAIYRRVHLGLAQRHQKAGRHDEAAAELVKATEYPRNFGVGRSSYESHAREYVAAARELEAAGKRDDADKLWQRAASDPLKSPVQPSEPWSEHYYYKALALDHVSRHDEARALYERLAALNDEDRMLETEADPPRGSIRFLLAGSGLKALGRVAEARAALKQALRLDPSNQLAGALLASLKAK
ncbi:MAG TPA: DUF5107 domain-containing protein [Acidobacteriota bacterium]|nr:DUF5107 domain-containing protein [Acidobacteriota bacterium]